MPDSVRPHRRQPTRLLCPWDSPGKNTGVGCHFLLQCVKVKSEAKSFSCVRLFATPWTTAYQAPPSVGFSRQEYWCGLPLPSPQLHLLLPYSMHQFLIPSRFPVGLEFYLDAKCLPVALATHLIPNNPHSPNIIAVT